MKIEVDLHIPDGYEFVRFGRMKKGEIGIRPDGLFIFRQHYDGMYENDLFIIKMKVKLTKKTRRYLYEDYDTHEEAVGLMNMAEAAIFFNLSKGYTEYFKNRKFIKWLEGDWQEYKI